MRDADAAVPRLPRAVPDAPVGPFVEGVGLAKAWLLELIARAPLSAAGEVPAARIAREGPALCAAVLRAVTTDEALRRLGPGGDLADLASGAGGLGGAADTAGVIGALDALRDVTSRALRSQDAPVDPGALADRVAHVCAVVAAASAGSGVAALPEVVVLDARRRTGSWRAALDRALAGSGARRTPVAVLAAELDDLDRILHAHTAAELDAAVGAATRAITGVLPADAVVGDGDENGRWTVVIPGEDSDGARALANRCAAAVARAAELRGVPIAVRIGVASCPADGTTADGLVEAADRRRFAAAAAGVAVL